MANLLLEIGLEEIPARMIDDARRELAKRVGEVLVRERLASDAALAAFSTPRRLAVLAKNVSASQPDVQETLTGPSVAVAYKEGKPTPAAEAFAKKAGVAVAELQRVSTPKGEYLGAAVVRKGRSAAEVLADALPKEIAALYWAKSMYWRAGKPERFVRPVRWMAALLDGAVVPMEFGGMSAGAESYGHRVLSKGKLKIREAAGYTEALEDAHVLADPAKREERIRKALDAAARTVPGARWREDAGLLETVVNLTEWPGVIVGSFDKSYLTLPEEVLVTVMRDHQKYFALEDAQGRLLPHFLAVLNTEGDADGLIRHGNERVLRARFNDARFFWDTDQKAPLSARVEMLRKVTFQKELGSYFDKARRMSLLVNIGGADFDRPGRKIDRNALHEAAWLAKADLTTELVKEFTELQGVVGGRYAAAQGMSQKVADAIYDHYKPASMEDSVPRSMEGAMLALADKADSIAGMFALGLQPTGSKDPFALRRQANGVIKIAVEHQLPLNLRFLFKAALDSYKGSEAEKSFKNAGGYADAVAGFMRERLEFYLKEVRGFAYDEVKAVLASSAEVPLDALSRVEAVAQVRKSADFESISIAFKRIKNILSQAKDAGKAVSPAFDPALAQDAAEKELAALAAEIGPKVRKMAHEKHYLHALAEVARLRPALDAFFDKVMVMVDDDRLRANRLALLGGLLADFSSIADFSEIVVQGR